MTYMTTYTKYPLEAMHCGKYMVSKYVTSSLTTRTKFLKNCHKSAENTEFSWDMLIFEELTDYKAIYHIRACNTSGHLFNSDNVS